MVRVSVYCRARAWAWTLAVFIIVTGSGVVHAQGATTTLSSQAPLTDANDDEAEGYFTRVKKARSARRFKTAGLIVAGTSYGLSAFLATCSIVCPRTFESLMGSGASTGGTSGRHAAPMFLPLAGPIWSLTYSDMNREPGNVFWLVALDVGQFLGVGLYAYGLSETPTTERSAAAVSRLSLRPLLSPYSRGLTLSGMF
jgi:hypothetical protein